MQSYQEKKRKQRLLHDKQERIILDEAKKTSAKSPENCYQCDFFEYCKSIIYTGKLLPCQPQNQDPIANMREHSDYSNWPTYQEYASLQL